MEADRPFTLLVSLLGERPTRFTFDQPRVLVGRGTEADLRIEHAAVSRHQFLLERGVGSMGEARFRITPYEATNATYVNDRPAVCVLIARQPDRWLAHWSRAEGTLPLPVDPLTAPAVVADLLRAHARRPVVRR